MRSLITLGVMRTCKLDSPGTYDSLLLEVGDSTIKHKHWFNLVEEKLANTVKQSKEVGIRQGVPVRVLEALHHLVQPNGYVYGFVKVSACSSIMKNSQKLSFMHVYPIVFHAFSSVVRQMPGYTSQRWGTVHTLPN